MTNEPGPELPHSIPTSITELLVSRFLGGNAMAADRLFRNLERSLRPLVRFHPLFRSLRGRMTEDDVLGELWKTLLERDSLEHFDDRGPGSLRAWLRGVLDRLMTDLARRGGAMKRRGGELPHSLDGSSSTARRAGQVAGGAPGPATIARVGDFADRCLRALPQREAEVWELRVLRELEFDEIASKLGCTPASARGLLHRARARLVELGILDSPEGRE